MLLYSQMPQTKSAKKALRREKRRERIKSLVLLEIKKSLVLTRRKPDLKNFIYGALSGCIGSKKNKTNPKYGMKQENYFNGKFY